MALHHLVVFKDEISHCSGLREIAVGIIGVGHCKLHETDTSWIQRLTIVWWSTRSLFRLVSCSRSCGRSSTSVSTSRLLSAAAVLLMARRSLSTADFFLAIIVLSSAATSSSSSVLCLDLLQTFIKHVMHLTSLQWWQYSWCGLLCIWHRGGFAVDISLDLSCIADMIFLNFRFIGMFLIFSSDVNNLFLHTGQSTCSLGVSFSGLSRILDKSCVRMISQQDRSTIPGRLGTQAPHAALLPSQHHMPYWAQKKLKRNIQSRVNLTVFKHELWKWNNMCIS